MAREETTEISSKTTTDDAAAAPRQDMKTEIDRPVVREVRCFVMTMNGCAMSF